MSNLKTDLFIIRDIKQIPDANNFYKYISELDKFADEYDKLAKEYVEEFNTKFEAGYFNKE